MVTLGVISSIAPEVAGQERFIRCGDFEELDAVSGLSEIWEIATELEPGYLVGEEMQAAAEAELRAVERELWPEVFVSGSADAGQRNSPSEERAMGPTGARGIVQVGVDWTLFDQARQWRRAQSLARMSEEEAASLVFDVNYRAQIAQTYVEVLARALRRDILETHHLELEELTDIVRRRTEAGVENAYEAQHLDETLTRADRLLTEAQQELKRWTMVLGAFSGRCVRPEVLTLEPGNPEGRSIKDSPELRLLRAQAEGVRAQAQIARRNGQFEAGPFVRGGIYTSRAYENIFNPEYILGLQGIWRPDFFEQRALQAEAAELRASALEAQARSWQRDISRQAHEILLQRDEAEERLSQLQREQALARRREETARLRWHQGVERWSEVLEARRRLQEVRLDELEWRRQLSLALIEYGRLAQRMDEVPIWLGESPQQHEENQ